MAGGKESPRQKMIGMMYLVLTALLALNVSKDILDAFAVIDEGIKKSTDSFQDKVDGQMSNFLASFQENETKVKPYYDKAKTVASQADELHGYINTMKAKIISSSLTSTPDNFENYVAKDKSGRDTTLGIESIEKKDDYDSPGYFLLGDDPAKPREDEHGALALQKKMESFRDKLMEIADGNPGMVARLQEDFKYEAGEDHSGVKMGWPSLTFYHQTVAATLTMLSKMQADVKTAESDVISYLYSSVDAASYKFNKLVPVVNSRASFLAPGDSFVADVYLAAIDTTKFPEIKIGSDYDVESRSFRGTPLDVEVVDGVGRVRMRPKGVGEKEWKGVINYETPGGGTAAYPFQFSYKVSDAGAVVDPTKMNVLYRGIANPVTVSVPGADPDKVKIAASLGGFSIKSDGSGPGRYFITPGKGVKGREVDIKVSAEGSNGKMKNSGAKTFRLKPLPPPTPLFMGKKPSDDVIQLVALKTGAKLFCVLEDFLFDGIKFNVTKFSLSFTRGGDLVSYNTRGDALSGEMRSAINGIRKNQIITFNNIYAVGPDGVEQKLASLSFKVI